MYTRDQQYAQAVFELIGPLKNEYPKAWTDEYGSMAHKLPVLIRTAGLAQALAFLEAKGKEKAKEKEEAKEKDPKALRILCEHLAKVVGRSDLVARSREAPLDEYMQLTRQCLDALLWFKRYAQSVLDVDASTEPQSGTGEEGVLTAVAASAQPGSEASAGGGDGITA